MVSFFWWQINHSIRYRPSLQAAMVTIIYSTYPMETGFNDTVVFR